VPPPWFAASGAYTYALIRSRLRLAIGRLPGVTAFDLNGRPDEMRFRRSVDPWAGRSFTP